MTEIKIFRNQDGHVVEYEVSGHTDFDDYGSDILCAAVSVLSQTTILALEKVCNISQNDMKICLDEQTGYLKVTLSENLIKDQRDSADIVLSTMILGMEDIALQYPKHIKLLRKEAYTC